MFPTNRIVSSNHRKGLTAAAVGVGVLGAAAIAVHLMARRAEARARPAGRFVSAGGRKIHYMERGQGRPVLLLHGNGAMMEELQASGLLDGLSKKHRVLIPDRPGFGWSARNDRGWTAEKEAAVILAFIRELKLDHPVIVAHSWSTLVALAVALENPDAISGLVLMGGYYYPTIRGDALVQSVVASPIIGDILRHTVWPLIARASAPLALKRVFSPKAPSKRFLAEYPLDLAMRPSQLTAVADDTVELPRSAARLSNHYRELLLPIDLIAGSGDKIVSTANQSRRLHLALHNSFFDEVPGAGHMVHHAHPDLVAQRVDHVFDKALKPVSAQALDPRKTSI